MIILSLFTICLKETVQTPSQLMPGSYLPWAMSPASWHHCKEWTSGSVIRWSLVSSWCQILYISLNIPVIAVQDITRQDDLPISWSCSGYHVFFQKRGSSREGNCCSLKFHGTKEDENYIYSIRMIKQHYFCIFSESALRNETPSNTCKWLRGTNGRVCKEDGQ